MPCTAQKHARRVRVFTREVEQTPARRIDNFRVEAARRLIHRLNQRRHAGTECVRARPTVWDRNTSARWIISIFAGSRNPLAHTLIVNMRQFSGNPPYSIPPYSPRLGVVGLTPFGAHGVRRLVPSEWTRSYRRPVGVDCDGLLACRSRSGDYAAYRPCARWESEGSVWTTI